MEIDPGQLYQFSLLDMEGQEIAPLFLIRLKDENEAIDKLDDIYNEDRNLEGEIIGFKYINDA